MDDASWTTKSPTEILADVNAFFSGTLNTEPPDSLVVHPDIYIAFIRATVKDPYQRLMMLWNAGCRGRELR